MQKTTLLLALLFVVITKSNAQNNGANKNITFSGGIESNLLQFAEFEQGNKEIGTIPRYTYFFNMGFDVNFKTTRHLQVFTGLNMKNIGLIARYSDSLREKHRVYTVGAPFGFKLHDAKNKVIFKTGVDISMAFNYKKKTIVNNTKTKSNEYFSNRTALFFPSVFAGLSVHGVSVTANYYLNNFFNPLHSSVSNWDARLFTLGIGLNMNTDKVQIKRSKKS
jgi:hypothetical protein